MVTVRPWQEHAKERPWINTHTIGGWVLHWTVLTIGAQLPPPTKAAAREERC